MTFSLFGDKFTRHSGITRLMEDLNDGLRTIGTPRRAALLVTGLAERQEDVSTETRGPSVAIAFDAEGNPTKAGAGFARGQGVEPSELIQRDGYVYAAVHEKGAETAQLLAELLPELIRAIPLPNSMRWGDLDFRFIRPSALSKAPMAASPPRSSPRP